ncbi:MAG: hypothetical protein ACREX3_07390 [Gammaproteobacteria bacterium]
MTEAPARDPSGPPDPKDGKGVLSWLEWYLLPKGIGGGGFRAHQFTINGLTYPFVRAYNFAAVPDPPIDRRYDMYSGLHLAVPGDLLFFFQSDPQDPHGDISSRRGIRGLYRVVANPYRAQASARDHVSGAGYELLHRCPACNTFHATFAMRCPECDAAYPAVDVRGEPVVTRVLSSHVQIEPLIAFERSVSDERAYADMSDPGLIWVGRHDNAMGPGKGSSIRHLMPEEAIKLARLLLQEPEQTQGPKSPLHDTPGPPLAHASGQLIDLLPTDANGVVKREDELYYLITRQLFVPNSHFRVAIQSHLPAGVGWEHLEYASSTFPWGYTGNTADFVLIFRNGSGRRFIVILECKRGRAHDEAVLQVELYAERVLQVAMMCAPPAAIPQGDDRVEILPVVIAQDASTPRIPNPRVAIPEPYSLERSYFGGPIVKALVRSPLFCRYVAPLAAPGVPPNLRPASGFSFQPLDAPRTGLISWHPDAGAVGTATELASIQSGSWNAARLAAGL